jgi:hypothetical protein
MATSTEVRTLCDLITHCRLRLDDVQPQSATSPATNLELLEQAADDVDQSELLWSDPELTLYANEAVRQVALRTRCIRDTDKDGVGVTQIAVSAGTGVVTLDPRILAITRVYWDGVPLPVTKERMMDEYSSTWRTDTGAVEAFILRHGAREIMLYRPPEVDGTLTLDVVRLPITLMSNPADEPEIQLAYRVECLHWMCHLAYLKNDADTRDPAQAALYANLFAQAVGPQPTIIQLEYEYYGDAMRRPTVHFY